MMFKVYGRLGVEFAPGAVIRFGRLRVGDLRQYPSIEAPGDLMVESDLPHIVTVESPPVFRVNGRFCLEVDAISEDDLDRQILEKYEPLVQLAVGLLVGEPVVARATAITDADGVAYAASRIVGHRLAPPGAFERTGLGEVWEALAGSAVVAALLPSVRRVHDLRLLTGNVGEAARDLELLELAKMVEAMASLDMFKDSVEELKVKRQLRDAALDEFRRRFSTAKSPEQVIKAIRRSASEFDRADESSTRSRIRRMAVKLGLDAQWQRDADALMEARNGVAHPRTSRPPGGNGLDGETGSRSRAWELVMECLAAIAETSFAPQSLFGECSHEYRVQGVQRPDGDVLELD